MNRPTINKLPIELANLIAAGEVVERPASVIKELVENSIDANATIIKIDLIESGLKKITIIDNGYGMSGEDIDLAVLPHATSKIKNEEDLFNISTLGFRGEALPSISSVSKLTITSSHNGYQGVEKKYHASKLISSNIVSHPQGTKVEVEDLFFNTPARLKYLSSQQVEFSHIMSFLNRCSIAYPNISFILSNNGRIVYSTNGDDDYLMIIRGIYGLDVSKNMIYFSGNNGLYKIKGYTSSNSVFRSNKNSLTMMINQRIIKNVNLTYAITDAYKSILPVGKYPITILMIEADESLVDVNVHPTKQDVRFTDEFLLRKLITESITIAINQTEMVYEQTISPKVAEISSQIGKEEVKIPYTKKEETTKFFDDIDDFEISKPVEINKKIILEENKIEEIVESDEEFTYEFKDNFKSYHINDDLYKKEVVEQTTLNLNERKNVFFKNMNYLGQYNKTYLLLEQNNDLYLLDQHAGMERFMYEKISSELKKDQTVTYELLIPEELEFPIYEINRIEELKNEFIQIGINFEISHNIIKIISIPTWIPSDLIKDYLSEIFNCLLNKQRVGKDIILDNLAKSLSCKKSIKANMSISNDEVNELLEKLDQCNQPFTCPHGRPTIIKFTKYEIEKLFKRVI